MHRLFYPAWKFHLHAHRLRRFRWADYEVCRHPLCRLAWWLEAWAWYR